MRLIDTIDHIGGEHKGFTERVYLDIDGKEHHCYSLTTPREAKPKLQPATKFNQLGRSIKMKGTWIVVDSNNHWLYYGEKCNASEAILEAQHATDYDEEAILYAYRVVEENQIF